MCIYFQFENEILDCACIYFQFENEILDCACIYFQFENEILDCACIYFQFENEILDCINVKDFKVTVNKVSDPETELGKLQRAANIDGEFYPLKHPEIYCRSVIFYYIQ